MFQRTELWLRKSSLSMLLIALGGNHDVWYVLREWRFKKNKDLPSIRVACQNGPNLCMGVNTQNLSPASKLSYWLIYKTGEIILLHCRDKIRSVLQAKVRVMAILYKLDLLRSKAGPHFFRLIYFQPWCDQKLLTWQKGILKMSVTSALRNRSYRWRGIVKQRSLNCRHLNGLYNYIIHKSAPTPKTG